MSHTENKILSAKKTVFKSKCLGPLQNLKDHLPSHWWKNLFNSMYIKTDADVVENEENTHREIDDIIKFSNVNKDSKILDICCGQGRHILEFAKRGFLNLTGVDRSQYLIRLAKKRASNQSFFFINFFEGDARKIKLPTTNFDLVTILGNSFGYFEQQEDDLKVLKEMNRILSSKGILILDISNGDHLKNHFEPRSWEWIDKSYLVCRERSLIDNNRLISREIIVHVNKGVIVDQFYAERLYDFQTIKHLLELADFTNIELLDSFESLSTRNQDLGMMANRMYIKAIASEKNSEVDQKISKTKIKCTVLLGDPILPDKVKKDSKFNEEDIDTVNRLKDALGSLEDFKFTFIDDHKNIFQKLKKNPIDLVFNLCDEGYSNDAKKELHIPALLEMLNIPYTGSAPNNLALSYDKSIVCDIAKSLQIEVPSQFLIDDENHLTSNSVKFPVLVKPSCGDGSIGITQKAVCNNCDELLDYINYLKKELDHTPILIQEFLQGREISVGVIGNLPDLEILPILEVDYEDLDKDLPKILSYESKWVLDSPYSQKIQYKQANLKEEIYQSIVNSCKKLFKRLDCKDYARFDFRADNNGNFKFLEINPNPGWCWDGKLNFMAGFKNISYSQLLLKILTSALKRYKKNI
ncbi:MAG: methyltransferase domain-containing protein [Parachlamydiales bacterium]|nr:methyltransferase domain-containing protein [Parachlamydiales bacterium]